jgi:hypothetical protein
MVKAKWPLPSGSAAMYGNDCDAALTVGTMWRVKVAPWSVLVSNIPQGQVFPEGDRPYSVTQSRKGLWRFRR